MEYLTWEYGLTTNLIYNSLNLLVKEEKKRAGETMTYQYVYDKAARQTVIADPKGNITAFEYDDAGRVKREVHYAPLSASTTLPDLKLVTTAQVPTGYKQESAFSYGYDVSGNLTDVTDRLGTQHFEIDELGRVETDVRGIDGKTYTTKYKYDSASNVKGVAYPGSTAAEEITYVYNKLNQLESVAQFADDWKTNPTILTKNFVYDPAGNLVQMRYNNGVITSITPNIMSRLENITVKLPQGGTFTNALELHYLYDANGNITNRNNNSYIYDELDRLKEATVEGKVIFEATPTLSYASGDYNITAAVDYVSPEQEVKFDYAAGTLGLNFAKETQVEQIDLLTSKQANHRITKDGIRIFRRTFWETFTEVTADQWDFRKDAQTGAISIVFLKPIQAFAIKIHSNYDDRDITTGLTTDRSTFANQLSKMVRVFESMTKVTIGYEYDSVGNRKTETYTLGYSNNVTYTYEYYTNSDRLKTRASNTVSDFTGDIRSEWNGSPVFGPSRGMAYQYDKAGNFITKGSSYSVNGDSVTYTQASGSNVAYWQYQYDAQNQLVTVFKNGETNPLKAIARYGYNYSGQRQKVVEGNRVTHYIYNLSGQVIQEVVYTTTSSDPYAATGARYYMHHDNLGSTVLVSGNDAVVVYQQDYLPFGQDMIVYSPAGTEGAVLDYKFTGQHEDRDTGLYYYGARYYDPEIGRFTQEDTYFGSLALPGSQNLYVYTLNNPLKYVDPTGHSPEVAHDSDWQRV